MLLMRTEMLSLGDAEIIVWLGESGVYLLEIIRYEYRYYVYSVRIRTQWTTTYLVGSQLGGAPPLTLWHLDAPTLPLVEDGLVTCSHMSSCYPGYQ